MKRAKLMLAAVAVLAIVGGVYASKAKQTNFIFVRGAQGTYCTSTLRGATLLENASPLGGTFATTSGTICTTTVPYFAAP